jgi:alpha-mannosidase
MSPLEVNEIKTQDKAINPARPLEAARSSFLTVDQPNVVLVTWKFAEDGQGSVLRFLEVAGQPGAVNVKLPLLNVQSAWRCNAVEENQESLPVSPHTLQFSVTPHQIVTVRVLGTSALK